MKTRIYIKGNDFMKNLKTLFNCNLDIEINNVKINSKEVKPGDLFICRKGINSDGHDFILDAVQNGAVAIVVDRKVDFSIPKIYVNNVNEAIPDIMDWYYGNPNDKIRNIIGVTGTNGKTTLCNLVNTLLNYKSSCACIGTNGIHCKNYDLYQYDFPNTTVAIDKLYGSINMLEKEKLENLVIEASSYGLKQKRLGNIMFDVGLVTNFSEAHMGEHSDMQDYISSKLMIIDKIKKEGYLILNRDDVSYGIFKNKCSKKVLTFGSSKDANLYFKDVKESLAYTDFVIAYKNKEYTVKTKMLGLNGVYNICAAFLICLTIGMNINDLISAVKDFYMPGKMENYKNVIIDYPATKDSLKKDLDFLIRNKKKKIIAVISRNDDERIKEYGYFGDISTKYCDYVIFTTDRNKTNNSLAITEMTKELKSNNYEIIYDRKKAIEKALSLKDDNDIIYLTGGEYYSRKKKVDYVNPYKIIDEFNDKKIETL